LKERECRDGTKAGLITKSNELALTGQFEFTLEFSEDDLNELMLAGIRASLEKNILALGYELNNLQKKI
jgi:hypothetical protein